MTIYYKINNEDKRIRLNTETAERVCGYVSGLSMSDFSYQRWDLYRSPKGQFFLVGEGHGNTEWAASYGNCRGWGEGCRLLGTMAAFQKCLQSDDGGDQPEVIEKFFGHLIQDG